MAPSRMTLTIELAWWWMPAVVTVLGLIWAIFIVDGGSGIGAGMANALALVPVLFVSLIAWAIAGFLR